MTLYLRIFAISFLVIACAANLAAAQIVHPGVTHSSEDIAFVKEKVDAKKEPWYGAWKRLKSSRYASLSHKPQPYAIVERGPYNNPDIGSSEFSGDGMAAYTHALIWSIGGEEAHAEKAAEILDAWSGKLEKIANHDAKLLIGMSGYHYCQAAELLKHTWDHWPEKKQKQFRKMMLEIWYPVIEDFHPSANGNWDASMMQLVIGMGVHLDDQKLIDRSVDYFRNGKGNGAIGNYFNEFGECQESGRDQNHTQMGLEFLSNTCQTAWIQGIDLYSEKDNRLLKGFEYTAKYNLGENVPYERYRSFDGRYDYKEISDVSRGRLRPMYEKVLRHYRDRQNIPAPFTQRAAALLRKKATSRRRKTSLLIDLLMFANAPIETMKDADANNSKTKSIEIKRDVVVYGATSAGVMAAVQLAKMGKSVELIESGDHFGGLTTGGLGATDIGNKGVIGGLSRQFYERVAKHYRSDKAWVHETREEFFANRSKRSKLDEIYGDKGSMWTFEPHVATKILRGMLGKYKVQRRFGQQLVRVEKDGSTIKSIRTSENLVFKAKVFIDASYEGDLMAMAGVQYRVGREANSEHNETLNGIRETTPKNQMVGEVDPYRTPGDPSSGLIPLIQQGDGGEAGAGDHRVQAYNFRLCFTDVPENRMKLDPPENYDPALYELAARQVEKFVAAGEELKIKQFCNPVWMPNRKTDINNSEGISTDFIGRNYEYPDADAKTRAEIWKQHEDYVRGFWYFMSNSERVPQSLRDQFLAFGPCRDEFKRTEGWSPQLYVREARRMVSDYVMTEHNCRGKKVVANPIGMAAYGMDSHNCQRIIKNGAATNEGDVQYHGFPPYPIAFESVVPKADQCNNLVVPVCVSATHIAFGSIRMEPVFMVLGQSAGVIAAKSIDDKTSVQDVDQKELRALLRENGQILSRKPRSKPRSKPRDKPRKSKEKAPAKLQATPN